MTAIRNERPAGNAPEDGVGSRLNWLRAAVLGANDGVVSMAGLVVGVAAATPAPSVIFTAGFAGLVSGAVSMALGEFVSVSSQRDSEEAQLARERRELAENPEAELAELAALYQRKGLSAKVAQQVATELSAHDALTAHSEVELHLNPSGLVSPRQAASASAFAFTLGGLLPLLVIMFAPAEWRVAATMVAALCALAIAGAVSARIGGASMRRAAVRLVVGGALGLLVTYVIGSLVGTPVK